MEEEIKLHNLCRPDSVLFVLINHNPSIVLVVGVNLEVLVGETISDLKGTRRWFSSWLDYSIDSTSVLDGAVEFDIIV